MIDGSLCEMCLERWQEDHLGGSDISGGREVEEK